MGNRDNLGLDDELVRSINKLVEEETNVAKAFVDNNASVLERRNTYREDPSLGETKYIDSKKVREAQLRSASASSGGNKRPLSSKEKAMLRRKREEQRRNRMIIAGMVALVSVVIMVIVAVALVVNSDNKKGYEYNYTKGMECLNNQDTNAARNYLIIAYNTEEGKKNIELMNTLGKLLYDLGEYDSSITVLETLLSYDKQNETGIRQLAELFYKQGLGGDLTRMINEYDNTRNSAIFDIYRIPEPSPSEIPGTLKEPVDLTLMASDGCTIYYTTDGSIPTAKSTKYSSPIKIEKDTVVVKAVAVSSIGVMSDVVTMEYSVSLQAPEAPVLSVGAGSVNEGTIITVDNLEEGSRAYYTVDGTTPTANSIIYQNGIELKAGNYVLSVVIINKSNLSSPITRKNINVVAVKTYSNAEAEKLLLNKLKAEKLVASTGKFTGSTDEAKLEYVNKQTIDGVSMYYYKLNRKKSNGTTTIDGYYGVGVTTGTCYRVTGTGSDLKAEEY